MKIRSKITGNISNVRGDIAKEMIKLGVAEEVPHDKSVSLIDATRTNLAAEIGTAQIPVPTFSVKEIHAADSSDHNGSVLVIEMKLADTVVCYSGDPERANARKEWDGGGRWLNGCGREIPAAILKEYKKRWNDNPERRGINFAAKVTVPAKVGTHEPERTVFL